jgi:hypothetical protein
MNSFIQPVPYNNYPNNNYLLPNSQNVINIKSLDKIKFKDDGSF